MTTATQTHTKAYLVAVREELDSLREKYSTILDQRGELLKALREIVDNCETFAKADNMAGRLHGIATAAIEKAGGKT